MLPKRDFNKKSVSLEIDLVEMFGKKITDPALRRNIAESLIEVVLKRVEKDNQGVNANGALVDLKRYSQAYIDSQEFKAFDKTKGDVNMKLTGSMLSSVDLISDQPGKIKIGIDNEEAPKAFNHLTGETVPRRPWLGLTSKDIENVSKEYDDQVKSDQPMTVKDIFEQQNLAKLANIVSNRKITGISE